MRPIQFHQTPPPIAHLATLLIACVLPVCAANWYVSLTGTNTDGQSWTTAWNELDQIDWSVVQPGDTIQIDGGQTSMTYGTPLHLNKSGTSANPIRIQLSQDNGRRGQAIFDGGREEPLPWYGQPQSSYTYSGNEVRFMVWFQDVDYVELDGKKWRGILIKRAQRGIRINGSHNLVKCIEVTDCGEVKSDGSTYTPDWCGIDDIGGSHVNDHNTFERVICHDNGNDNFQFSQPRHLTLRRCWSYNSRTKPSDSTVPFWNPRHGDGLQIFGWQDNGPIIIEESIIGNGTNQGFIFSGGNNHHTTSIIRNCLFLNHHCSIANANFINLDGPHSIDLSDVTSVAVNTTHGNNFNFTAGIEGSSKRHRVFYYGAGLQTRSGEDFQDCYRYNCIYYGSENIPEQNPQFVRPANSLADTDFDYAFGNSLLNQKNVGTTITSVAKLMANKAPTVSITNISNGSTISTGLNTISVNAHDSDGVIIRVEFDVNGTMAATDQTWPHEAEYAFSQPGLYTITVRAFDNNNAQATATLQVTADGPVQNTVDGHALIENRFHPVMKYEHTTLSIALSRHSADTRIDIFAANGAVVQSNAVTGTTASFCLQDLGAGLYCARLRSGSHQSVLRFVHE